ncbi:MAG: sulfotransferase, partial [Mycobacterium sp.]
PSTVEGPDPRIAAATAQQEMMDAAAPRLAALVPSTPTGPEECQDLMALDFKSQYFQAFAHIPSYSRWLLDADLTPTYAYERRTLKLLQWGQPRRHWRLKCPTHLLFLPHLDKAFPDARYVWTHRDPTEVILSVADLYVEFGQMTSNTVDRRYLGQLNVEQWSVGMQRALEFRDVGNDNRFFDLDFAAVQRDPIGEVKRLYAWLDEPVSAEFEAGMQEWWQVAGASRLPNTHPDASAFGLRMEAVRPLFADYVQRMTTWTASAVQS